MSQDATKSIGQTLVVVVIVFLGSLAGVISASYIKSTPELPWGTVTYRYREDGRYVVCRDIPNRFCGSAPSLADAIANYENELAIQQAIAGLEPMQGGGR